MLCCTSAPPTTGMPVSRASTGQVVGARKQTCGRGAAFWMAPSAVLAGRPSSSGVGKGMGADITLVDALEVAGRHLDGSVGSHPALLLGRDRLAVEVGVDDGVRE